MKLRLAILLFSTFILLLQGAFTVRAQGAKIIEIKAKRFGYSPNEITLKKGETVTLRFTSDDVVHGIFLRPLKIDADIQPGKPTDVTITPQAPGSFSAICDHFCGVNHGAMNMKITVVE